MSKKDMLRSTWTRVTSKKQIIRDYTCGECRGKVSLLKILEINGALKRTYDNQEIVLADVGYYWLQLAFDGSPVWYTVMFDSRKRLVQIYIDVTDGNHTSCDNPFFEDMYLDYVVCGDKVYELDRDELEEAFSGKMITKEQYEVALSEGTRIETELRSNLDRITTLFNELFEQLLAELPYK